MKKFYLCAILIVSPVLFTGCSVVDKAKDLWNGVSVQVDFSPEDSQHTVIVPGYGAPVAGNSGYEGYIKAVADYVNNTANGVDAVVFTGGYSSLENTSEAESMNSYFNSIVDTAALTARGVRVYKEQCSIVSWQNVTYTKDVLTADSIQPDEVVLFGDSQRGDKLKSFASFVFNTDLSIPDSPKEVLANGINYTSVDFTGYDFGSSVKTTEERNAIFAIEIAGAYDPTIGNTILQERIDDWSDTYGYDVAKNLVAKGCAQYAGFK